MVKKVGKKTTGKPKIRVYEKQIGKSIVKGKTKPKTRPITKTKK